MTDGKVHGTDCFEVDSFLQRNGFSKLYQVRHKETGEFFTMEVAPRDVNSRAPVSPYVQQTKSSFSHFWVSLRFAFQTRSKFYYILDFPGKQTLSQLIKSYGGLIPEVIVRFYAAEILIALEELHKSCLAYKDLCLDTVYLDSEGHVIIWRSFCGRFYWSKRECVCSLDGFNHGDPCDNNHNLKSDFDFQEDWKSFGSVVCAMLTGESHPWTTKDRSLSAAANDLISRLLRGEVCRSEQIQSHLFFKGVNWYEVRTRRSRPPMGNSDKSTSLSNQTSSLAGRSTMGPTAENDSSLQRPQSISRQSDPSMRHNAANEPSLQKPLMKSRNSNSSFEPNTENGPSLSRPQSVSRHSDPSEGAHLVNGPSWSYRPHSQSHHSDPGDPRCLTSTADLMVPGPRLHHAVSTPDLRTSGRDSPVYYQHPLSVKDLKYHYGNRDYCDTRARDFGPRPEGEVERRGRLVSRSMSDLSSLANDTGFVSHSPTALHRTLVYPNYETVPPYANAFHLHSDEFQEIYNGGYGFHSKVSVPDLSASFLSFSPPYYSPHSGRASPNSPQYSELSSYSSYGSSPRSAFMQSRSRLSDDGLSLSGSANGTRETGNTIISRRYEPRSSRELDYLRSKSETPTSFGRGQTPVDYSSPQSKITNYKSPTQQSSLPGSMTRDEANRTSNEGSRERSSTLSRTLSLSNLENEKKPFLPEEFSEKRRESLPLSTGSPRDKYPLAKVPIPSFREFKQKNLEKDSKNTLLGSKKETKGPQSSRSPKTSAKHDSKTDTDIRPTLKERLSSLYESSKDISAQNATKKMSESYKLNVKTQERISTSKSTDLTGANIDDSVTGKETKASRKISKGREDSPFSKNEVIHQLMLKYGLYEKGGQKNSRSPKDESRETLSGSSNSDAKDTSGENASNRTLTPLGKEKATLESEKNWRNSTDHSNRHTPAGSSVSPWSNKLTNATESKKSAAERFRELRRKNGIRRNIVKSSSDAREVSKKGDLGEGNSSERTKADKDNVTKNLARNDPDSSMADIIEARTLDIKIRMPGGETSTSKDDDFNADSNSSSVTKGTLSLRGTSRAILCATKFRRNKVPKSPDGSPLPSKKQLPDIIGRSDVPSEGKSKEAESKDVTDVKKSDSLDRSSPKNRRRRFRGEGGIRRDGIHTSMLSVASSACSDTELEDTVSIYSLDDERGTRGRRWESFHSNVSADSGSAHLFEFDTDSNITEYDEVFDDQDSEADHSKGEVDVERTDSGVGGDMGHSPLRRSWEEIVMKSSEHWSVVAASARHWQELARRGNANEGDTVAPKKKSSVNSITEDMVECPDCLKHYVPSKEKNSAREPEICPKCEDRKVERKEAIIELVQTEINYGNDLQVLKEEFYLPMQSGGILNPENLAAIFLNLQELLEVNSKFCAKLQKSLEESVSKGDEEFAEVNVGAIFLESVDFFQAYEIYCSKQTAASALLESLQKKAELLRIFLNVTCRENPKCRKMDLNSFILAPVQRIMKYPLLLSRICKATPRRNTDREKLKMAQRKIEEQLNKINALNTAVESRQKRYRASQQLGRSDSLDKLQMKKMASDILNWTLEEMQLLMHGVFQVTIHEFGAAWNRRSSKKALSVCALFCVRGHSEFVRVDSDDEGKCEEPLFPGEGEVTDAAIVLLRKKMSGKYILFKDPLFLDMCVIYRDCEPKDAFEVVSVGKESYVFRASTSREYRRWLKYLRLESKELGAWKRRRNGLPNIMIKNL